MHITVADYYQALIKLSLRAHILGEKTSRASPDLCAERLMKLTRNARGGHLVFREEGEGGCIMVASCGVRPHVYPDTMAAVNCARMLASR